VGFALVAAWVHGRWNGVATERRHGRSIFYYFLFFPYTCMYQTIFCLSEKHKQVLFLVIFSFSPYACTYQNTT
jgi:hypothetical protein